MEYGIAAGHWRQTTSTGNARKVVYFDALLRPLVDETFDAAIPSATRSITARRYDGGGRLTFQSYPRSTLSSFADLVPGTRTLYDALDRVTQVHQDSELGVLTTTTQYLNGFQTRVINPRLKETTASYMVYDAPVTTWPLSVAHPEGAFTDVSRDAFGKPLSITRRDASGTLVLSRKYAYDGFQKLCKTIEPETGATVQDYDGAGNQVWSASGLSLPSPGDCNRIEAQNSGRRIDRSYDGRNRLIGMSFPGLNGNQSWQYTPDGLPAQIATLNEGGAASVVNTYSYNGRRLLTGEGSSQSGLPAWSLGYGYNANGHLASHVYLGGPMVDYAPNALGQPTKAGAFASGVTYHPNGAMAQLTYGNGIVHTMNQNVRGLPDRSVDQFGTAAVLDDGYDYDANGNVAAISDAVPGNRGNRDMTYDGQDRLATTVSATYGTFSYGYDVLDNLTRVVAPGSDHFYCYDSARWQLTNIKTGGCGGSTVVGLGYDEQGNLSNKNGSVHTFDYGNRLREVSGIETYRYDGFGRRVLARQALNGDVSSVYDADGVLRHEVNQRTAKAYDYITLNGSLIAKSSKGVVPGAPTVTAPDFSTTGNYLIQWSSVPAVTSYELQEASNGGPWQGLYVGAGLSQSVSSRVTGTYRYRVRACNGSGCGSWSAEATVSVQLPPATPPSLAVPAVGLNGTYTVSWGASAGATTYTLEESINGGGWVIAYTGSAQSASFSSRPAGTYAYRIKACNPAGCSAYSATSALQAIYAPGGAPSLSAPSTSATDSFNVSWIAVGAATRYELEESANGGAWTQIQNNGSTSKLITGKANGSYGYRARACNDAGCGPYSGVVLTAVLLPPSGTPALSVPASSLTGSYTVAWTGVATAASYQLEEQSNGGAWVLIQQDASGARSVGGKGTGTYGYRVRGCNASGCGPWSASGTIAVTLPPPTPASLTGYAEPIDSRMKEFNIFWSDSPGATYYELKSTTTHYTGPNTMYDFTGVGTKSFSVRACNAAGCSDWKGGLTL